MDLTFTPRQQAFRAEAREWLEANVPTGLPSMNTAEGYARHLEWERQLFDARWAVVSWPEEYGGRDADLMEWLIFEEEYYRSGAPGRVTQNGIFLLAPTLFEHGTQDQRDRYLAQMASGEKTWAQGWSEPNAGSDLASLTTSAVLDGDEWVVNGQKIWTSTAELADWMFCLVRTEPELPRHQGLSFLLFSMKSPGIRVRPLKTMTGDAHFNEVFFTDVRVPRDQIVGQRGQGWHVANIVLLHERDDLGDPDATLQRLNALVELMKQETAGGQRVIDGAVYRDRLMRLQGRVLALRYNHLRLLSAKLNGKDASLAAMIVKLQGTELRHELEGLAVDALGEFGILYDDGRHLRDGGSWQAMYMFYLGLIIGGGTSQIQKNIISERGLGMPREPKPKV